MSRWGMAEMTSAAGLPSVAREAERLRLLVDAVEEYAIFVLAPDGTVMTWNPGAQRLKGYTGDEIVGGSFEVFYLPEDIAAGKPAAELVAAAHDGSHVDDGWRVRKDGTRFWAHVVITALYDESGLRGFAKVTRDDTAARAAAQRGRAMQEITTALLDELDPSDVLALVVRHARELTGAARTWLATTEQTGLVVRATDGDVPGPQVGDLLPAPRAAEVLATGRPTVLDELADDASTSGLGGALVVPLAPGPDSTGVLVAAPLGALSPFRPLDLELLQMFATQAALVLRYARAQQALRAHQLSEDRERIARDLHDHVIQQLFATGMTLQSVALRTAAPDVRARLHEAVDRLDDTIRQVRTTIFDLERHASDQAPALRAQILDLVREASDALGYQPSTRLDGAIDTAVAPQLREHLLAALREMLSNLGRHADASAATVSVSVDDEITVTVADNGVEPGDAASSGNGIRAGAPRGAFTLTSSGDPVNPGGTVATWRAAAGPRPRST